MTRGGLYISDSKFIVHFEWYAPCPPLLTCGLSSFPECRVVKSTSYTKIASSSPQEHHQEPRAFPAQQPPASTSSGKAAEEPGSDCFVCDDAEQKVCESPELREVSTECRFRLIILEHGKLGEQLCQSLACWL